MFDVIGAQQFCVLASLGLREHHRLLDVGCGCLRGGRFFVPYLDIGNYCGLEPDEKLLDDGIFKELGRELGRWRVPVFYHFYDFHLSRIRGTFDYVLAQSILSHAGKDIAETLFSEAYKVLVDSGAFVATWFDGLQDTTVDGWHPASRIRYRDSTMAEMAMGAGFENLQVLDVRHPMGQTWFVARKA